MSYDLSSEYIIFYANDVYAKGWSRDMLNHALKSEYHLSMQAVEKSNNFDTTLPAQQADYANDVFRSSYNLGFIDAVEPLKELVELFGVLAPTLRVAIKAIYKSGTLCPVSTQRCDLATPKSWATFYNLEVVIVLAFRLKTYEASLIRQKVLEGLCQRKENGIDFLILLGNNSHLYYN